MSVQMDGGRPSLSLLLGESRALLEFNAFYYYRILMRQFAKGDGHPVLVMPGFMASDYSTAPMRGLLKDLKYNVSGWGLGRNMKFNAEREDEMHALLERMFKAKNRKVSIVGWSLGGVFAREIAKANPQYVRTVISLGSPISHAVDKTNASALFTAINGQPTEEDIERYLQLNAPPPVPTSSIYSKTDGIVNWKHSVQQPYPDTENIEVPASHMGLGFNPLVMFVIADRLAQREGDWKPFDISGLKKVFFNSPDL